MSMSPSRAPGRDGMPRSERRVSAGSAAGGTPPRAHVSLRAVWPQIWELVRPRRGKLALGFLLMAVNRVSGLVLPAATK
ncbi:MAG TPA: ABC transporter ATP-binding protein, partial [Candidatus Eisenbacteria bacterium]|nr:ABC transporter ATP-binding protein [Candidatus Eisenbacteria bacterium]